MPVRKAHLINALLRDASDLSVIELPGPLASLAPVAVQPDPASNLQSCLIHLQDDASNHCRLVMTDIAIAIRRNKRNREHPHGS